MQSYSLRAEAVVEIDERDGRQQPNSIIDYLAANYKWELPPGKTADPGCPRAAVFLRRYQVCIGHSPRPFPSSILSTRSKSARALRSSSSRRLASSAAARLFIIAHRSRLAGRMPATRCTVGTAEDAHTPRRHNPCQPAEDSFQSVPPSQAFIPVNLRHSPRAISSRSPNTLVGLAAMQCELGSQRLCRATSQYLGSPWWS
jgi:hypothetical protein